MAGEWVDGWNIFRMHSAMGRIGSDMVLESVMKIW